MNDVAQQIDQLVANATKALEEMWALNQDQIDKIVHEMTKIGAANAEPLGKLAYEETGMGKLEHKIHKNQLATELLWKLELEGKKSVGIIGEKDGIIEVAEPFGVVVAVTPVTHPTANTMFKCIVPIKGRNVVIVAYHPKSQKSATAACRLMRDTAVAAGAPANCIQWIEDPSIEATNYLMKHPDVDLIVATGGGAMVKAAYSSGHPCLGVGPGNVPAYIDKTANLNMSVNTIISSKTYDNGSICASEQVLIFDDKTLCEQALKMFSERNCYICNEEEKAKLEAVMFDKERGVPTLQVVAQPATKIAALAGLNVPSDTKILMVPVKAIGPQDYMSHEKLSPVLGWYVANNKEDAIKTAVAVLDFGGAGHTAAIHSHDEEVLKEYGLAVPAYRVVFNHGSSTGAFGASNSALPLTFTIGCGSRGGNSTSDNVTYKHMLNIKRMVRRVVPESTEE